MFLILHRSSTCTDKMVSLTLNAMIVPTPIPYLGLNAMFTTLNPHSLPILPTTIWMTGQCQKKYHRIVVSHQLGRITVNHGGGNRNTGAAFHPNHVRRSFVRTCHSPSLSEVCSFLQLSLVFASTCSSTEWNHNHAYWYQHHMDPIRRLVKPFGWVF